MKKYSFGILIVILQIFFSNTLVFSLGLRSSWVGEHFPPVSPLSNKVSLQTDLTSFDQNSLNYNEILKKIDPIDTFKQYHSLSPYFFVFGIVALSCVIIFTNASYFLFFLQIFFLIPLIHKFYSLTKSFWERSFLKKFYQFFTNNLLILLFFFVLLFSIEILSHIFPHGFLPEWICMTFTVISVLCIFLYAVPLFFIFYKNLFKIIDFIREGKNPFRCIGMSFVRGFVLLLFLILPLLGLIHIHFSVIAFIALVIRVADVFEFRSREYQKEFFEDHGTISLFEQMRLVLDDRTTDHEMVTEEDIALFLAQGKSPLIAVFDGETVPRIDGCVEKIISPHKQCYLNKSFFSGEESLISIKEGHSVEGGSIVQGATIYIRVSKVGENTAIGKMQKMQDLIKESAHNETEQRVKKMSDFAGRYYLLIIFVLGLLCFSIVYILSHSLSLAIVRSLTIFIVVCPCSFFIAIPLSFTASRFFLMSSHNVYLVNNKAFFVPDLLLFDKTNTLTTPDFLSKDNHSLIPVGSYKNDKAKCKKFLSRVVRWESALKENNYHANRIVQILLKNQHAELTDDKTCEELVSINQNVSERTFCVECEEGTKKERFYVGNLRTLREHLSEEDYNRFFASFREEISKSVDFSGSYLFYDFQSNDGIFFEC